MLGDIFVRFNRYIVECKSQHQYGVIMYTQDLIDTQWNVNLQAVLGLYITDCRFNRYIVECKLKLQHMSYMNEKDLIDTQWNVNLSFDIETSKVDKI